MTYIDEAIAAFDRDPADSDYQRGYLAALINVRDDGRYSELCDTLKRIAVGEVAGDPNQAQSLFMNARRMALEAFSEERGAA